MKITLFACLIFFVGTPVFAQRTLDFFVQAAFANDPEIRDFDNQQRSLTFENQKVIAQNQRPQVWWTGDVMVAPFFSSKFVEITPNPSDRAVGFDPGISNGAWYSGLANVSYPVWNKRIVQPQLDQISVQNRVLQNQIALKKRDIRKTIADQFVNTLAAQEQIAVSDTLLNLLDQQINLLQKLVRANLASVIDLENLRIERENERLVKLQRSINLRFNLLQINLLAGITDTAEVLLSSELPPVSPPANEVVFHSKFRLDSLAAANQQAISETKYLPNFTLNGGAGLNAIQLQGIERRVGFQAGIHFQQPIFDGNQREMTRSQTRIGLETIAAYRQNFDRQRQIALANDLAQIRLLDALSTQFDQQTLEYRRLLDLIQRQASRSEKVSATDILLVLRQSKQVELDKNSTRNQRRLAVNDFNFWNE